MDIVTIASSLSQGHTLSRDIAPTSATGSEGLQANQSSTKKPDDPASPPTLEQLNTAVKAVNSFVQPINNDLEFSIDKDTGKTVVKVIDINTKEVIKQFPSEEMLAIAKALDGLKGLLVQQKA